MQTINKEPVWNGELLAMGYNPPLPAPIPTIQTTLSAIDLSELHQYIQKCSTASLTYCNEEGVHLPLMIDSLDLFLWTSLFVTTTTESNKTLANIKSVHAKLSDLLIQNEQDTTKSVGFYSMIKEAITLVNNNVLESASSRSLAEP